MKFIPGGPPRMQHQKRGLAKMIRTRGSTALLFEPGLGKTGTTLDYASLLALKSPTREARVLVVAPLAAVDTWVLQAGTFVSPQVNFWAEALGGGSILDRGEALAARGGNPFSARRMNFLRKVTRRRLPAHSPRGLLTWKALALDSRGDDGKPVPPADGPDALGTRKPRLVLASINFDSLSSRQQISASKTMADFIVEAVRRFAPDLVVVDESHKIKSATSNVSRLMARIGEFAPRRVILTGTVMPLNPMDIYGQWRFLEPYAFGSRGMKMTYGTFQHRFAVMGGYMGREVKGFKNLDEMQNIMSRNAVVATKDEALDLPETTDNVVPVHLSSAESKAYQEMKSSLATSIASGQVTVVNRLAQMMRLRQITSGHLPDDGGAVHAIGDSKVQTIKSLVTDTLGSEKRVVIFAMFTHEIAMLEKALASDTGTVEVIAGGTTEKDRIAIRKRFGDIQEHPGRIVLIAQIKTLSLAVNELVTASHAVFGSLSWQRDDIVQARDRLNRIGQTRPVTYWYAIAPGTVDQVIWRSYLERSDLEQNMLRHIVE